MSSQKTLCRSFMWDPLADELSNVTAEEWMFVDRFYMEFREYGDLDDLRRMVACLYRPERKNHNPKAVDYNGDIRQLFNINLIDDRVILLQLTSVYKLLAIMHWYEGCRHAFVNQFPRVFTEGNQEQAEFHGWPEVFMNIATTGVFGTLEEVNNTEISTVLLQMQVALKDQEKAQNNKPVEVEE